MPKTPGKAAKLQVSQYTRACKGDDSAASGGVVVAGPSTRPSPSNTNTIRNFTPTLMDISSVPITSPAEGSGRRAVQNEHDADVLAGMGHSQELSRQFSSWSMFALAFTVLGTWSTFSQNLSDGITNGGPVGILWGLVLVTFCNLCVAVSLGELTSAMPTAMGQAYWIYRLWTTPTGRFFSYMCAWINTFGWWTITASQAAFMSEFMLALKALYDPDWSGANYGWIKFLIYLAVILFLTVVNAVACRKDRILPAINSVVGVMFILLFLVFCLALLISVGVKPDLNFQSARWVFTSWMNQSSWSGGVTWFVGLVQAAYGLTAFDACIHMVEELPNPAKSGPRIIWLSVLTGAVTGFVFMVVCLFCMQNYAEIVDADYAFITLCQSVLGVNGAAVLLALFIINGVGQNLSLATTASRLTWSFARDGGIPFYHYFAKVDDKWRSPVRATWAQGVIAALIGVLYLFADTVLSAILSVSTIALTISYALPIVVLLIVGRDQLPDTRGFHLGRYGMTCNIVSVIYCSITTVFFFFPGDPNPTTADMNWAIAVFGVMLVIAIGFWFVQGHRSYLQTDTATFGVVNGQHDQLDVPVSPYKADEDARNSSLKKMFSDRVS
jgi:amino acid transporter